MGDIVRVNEMMNVKSLELCLKHSKQTKYIDYYYYRCCFLVEEFIRLCFWNEFNFSFHF